MFIKRRKGGEVYLRIYISLLSFQTENGSTNGKDVSSEWENAIRSAVSPVVEPSPSVGAVGGQKEAQQEQPQPPPAAAKETKVQRWKREISLTMIGWVEPEPNLDWGPVSFINNTRTQSRNKWLIDKA